ncbi:hypothetical protein DICVIV_03438 [Dictyocaulus viviparus]|uniref:Caspase family p20 domain-containing protein n=1 Tax=Dictyocaulus viviparus TaxID=29172 RepID=A0A0D8Y2N4_DICVI|nr:hypothetical protein DICVIV_03438 [Dictyocaulus viviparus]
MGSQDRSKLVIFDPCLMSAMKPAGILEDLKVDMIDNNASSQMEMYLKNRDSIYPNFSCPKGLCLIINNENFLSMPRRKGTEIDCVNLKNLFQQLGYNVLIENDLSCKEMLECVRSFANDTRHHLASSTIVVVLTHGERDQLLGESLKIVIRQRNDKLSFYCFD